MRIAATVKNTGSTHEVVVQTASSRRSLTVPPKDGGGGSSVNGGEFLMLALATCYCNDIYREAARLNVVVTAVEVEAAADFEGVGLSASNVQYRARVSSPAAREEVDALLRATDAVAEVHNTLRKGVPVQWVPWEPRSES